MKLAVLTSHPIQYQVPLFRKLAAKIDLTVYFCSRLGVDGKVDPGFGVPVRWDRPLLEGYSHRFLTNYSPLASPLSFFSFINPGILSELKKNRYDAVFIHGYGYATAVLAILFSEIPVIFHGETVVKNDQNGMKRAAVRRLLSKTKAFLYIGEKSRQFYQSFGIPDNKLFFSPYSVDNDFFLEEAKKWKPRQMELKREARIPEHLPVILYVSKLTNRKRPFDLLKAFQPIHKEAALVFVGDGEEATALKAYVRKESIQNVYFQGFKNQTELPRYYAMADIFVLPSAFETWGLVVNEAMCFELPIITTDQVTSGVDLVASGENGYLYPVGETEKLTNALKKLVLSKDERAAMGKKSGMKISNWNYDRCIDGILKALDFAIGK